MRVTQSVAAAARPAAAPAAVGVVVEAVPGLEQGWNPPRRYR